MGRSGLLAILCLLALPAAGSELAGFPPSGKLVYAVIRDDDRIGTQTVEFRREADRLTVATRIDIEVSLLGLTVYDFHHEALERWQDGRLVALASKTDDNGEARAVEASSNGGKLAVTIDGEPREAPADILPASLWHPGTIKANALFDLVRGKVRRVSVTDLGVEEIVLRGAKMSAHRYAITGELKREVWYGPDGQIVRVRFAARDGSIVTLALQ